MPIGTDFDVFHKHMLLDLVLYALCLEIELKKNEIKNLLIFVITIKSSLKKSGKLWLETYEEFSVSY